MRKTLLISAFIVLLLIPGSIWAYPPVPRSNILIEEIDGSPSDYIHTLKVSNGALTIANKVGTLSISTIVNYGDDAQFYITTYADPSSDYSRLRLRKSDSATVLDETEQWDYLGIINFEGCNTTPAFAQGSRIWSRQTNTAGAMVPSELRLNTSDDTNLFSEQLVLSDDFRVGVGILENEKPLATFHVQGTAYVPLTGTVTTVRNTTGVEGAGTSFDTELFVGAPIRITSDHGTAIFSEVFTVAGITDADTLTLDSNYEGTGTAGLKAWTDGDLFKVSDREKNVKFTIDNKGKYGRDFSKLDLTTDTSITEDQIIANKYISNQGDAGEADLTLPAVSYAVQVIFSVEEAQNIEINPPSGEIFDLDGVALDADDCVDSDSTVGSKISATRLQIADASWRWSLDTIRGVWTDTGASD